MADIPMTFFKNIRLASLFAASGFVFSHCVNDVSSTTKEPSASTATTIPDASFVSTTSLKKSDISFNRFMGPFRKGKDKYEKELHDSLRQLMGPIIAPYSTDTVFLGNGLTSIDFKTLPEKIAQNSRHAKHNINWLTFHGKPIATATPNKQGYVAFYDNFLTNIYGDTSLNNKKSLADLLLHLSHIDNNAENTTIIQTCYSAAAAFNVREAKINDMYIFSGRSYDSHIDNFPSFLHVLKYEADNKHERVLDRSTLIYELFQANAFRLAKPSDRTEEWTPKRNLYVMTIATDENMTDQRKAAWNRREGSNTRVIDMEDQGKNLHQYSIDDIKQSMRKQFNNGFGLDDAAVARLQQLSRNVRTARDLESLSQEDFFTLSIAVYSTCMNHLEKMPRLDEYYMSHNTFIKEKPPAP